MLSGNCGIRFCIITGSLEDSCAQLVNGDDHPDKASGNQEEQKQSENEDRQFGKKCSETVIGSSEKAVVKKRKRKLI